MTAETGQSSGSKPSDDAWAKLVPLDTRFSDIEISCNDMVICSEIKPSSSERHEWCRITKNLGPGSATIHNKSSDAILVDEAIIPKDGAVDIMSGSEIVPGPGGQGYLQYRFTIMPAPESRTQILKISIDPDNAKCSICLNVWHDVVTAAPCLHNFCNGCFSEWMRRSEEKHQHVLCPQCRTTVQFVGRNHFLQNIQEDILKADTALRWPAEDIAVLDSSASIQSNLMGKTVQDVAAEWFRRFNNREIDRSRMPLNHAETITASTHVCNDCYDKLVGFLLYWFRITLPRDHLPAAREDCWYGYACRTQHHNEEHARKRNHVCRPTRGNHHF